MEEAVDGFGPTWELSFLQNGGPSRRTGRAKQTPLVAPAGTGREALMAQFAQSTSRVGSSMEHSGCTWGSAALGRTTATRRAPRPP